MQDRWEEFRARIRPVAVAPPLRRINGFGVTLLGVQREVPGTQMRIKGLWVTALFIPLFPAQFYIVTGGPSMYRFHGSVSVWSFIKLYRSRAITYYLTVILESALYLAAFAVAIGIAATLSYGIHSLLR
ncbi:MAG: hypothetical protein JWR80_9918 [Bradyrhizobium sp.]|nr:hypothetical protein [Bradyrhizobium sp.]